MEWEWEFIKDDSAAVDNPTCFKGEVTWKSFLITLWNMHCQNLWPMEIFFKAWYFDIHCVSLTWLTKFINVKITHLDHFQKYHLKANKSIFFPKSIFEEHLQGKHFNEQTRCLRRCFSEITLWIGYLHVRSFWGSSHEQNTCKRN